MKTPKVIVEKHPDGYVAYPLGLKGAVVGQGDTYEEALADVRSAIQFHVDTFGPDVFEEDNVEILSLSINPQFQRILERSEERLQAEGSLTADEVRRRLAATES